MNIGIVTTWFERGAAYVSKQFEEVLNKQHRVYIYARGGEKYAKGDSNWDKENVTWGKVVRSPFVATVIDRKDFERWIKKNKIDLVIFNEQHWFQPLLWCKKMNIKTVAYIDYYTERTIPLFDIYDALICNTKRHKQAFVNHHNAEYIPWGTDVNLFVPHKEELVNDGVVTFFHSAGLSGDRKGTDIFIKAIASIENRSFKAIIHTQNELLPQFPELADTIERLQNQGRLKILTRTVTAPGLYHLGDVYVYPSRLEGIGLTIAESISCGLACIVPNNGPMNEFVNNSFGQVVTIDKFYSRADGYYWPKCECDIQELANAMIYYIENPEIVVIHKANARKYAINKLSYEKNFRGIIDLVETVKFNPVNPKTFSQINAFDNFGLKRLQKYFLLLGLNYFIRK